MEKYQSYDFTDDLKTSLKNDLDIIYKYTINNNYPIILGEMGTKDKSNNDARINHAKYYAEYCHNLSIPILVWDNGIFDLDNSDPYGLYNRYNYSFTYVGDYISNSLINGYNDINVYNISSIDNNVYKIFEGDNVAVENNYNILNIYTYLDNGNINETVLNSNIYIEIEYECLNKNGIKIVFVGNESKEMESEIEIKDSNINRYIAKINNIKSKFDMSTLKRIEIYNTDNVLHIFSVNFIKEDSGDDKSGNKGAIIAIVIIIILIILGVGIFLFTRFKRNKRSQINVALFNGGLTN